MKLLFVINPGSGKSGADYTHEIENWCKNQDPAPDFELFELPKDCEPDTIKRKIDTSNPQRVIAVGGDGTVKLVAEALINTPISMGIIPGGSANGLAKELDIPQRLEEALECCIREKTYPIHVTRVNQHLCIHLSDIGFNAFVVKKFEDQQQRGMWGYIRAAFKTLFDTPVMDVSIKLGGERIKRTAAMVVIANGTRYGSGALINPQGMIDDSFFEVVIVRKISFSEIFKMMVTHRPYDPKKTEVFQTNQASLRSKRKAHFQVDGEYLGKVFSVNAELLKNALQIAMPGSALEKEN